MEGAVKKLLGLLLLTGLILAACSGGSGTPTPDSANIPIVSDNFAVSAEGRLVPGKFAELSFSGGGKVAEVSVAEGAVVSEGDVLARLENSESLQSSVAQAEQELLNAQQALDDLKNNAALAAAQAQMDVAQAQDALDKANRKMRYTNNPDVKFYQDRLTDAQNALLTAQENQQVTDIGSLRASLQHARDNLKDWEERLGKVKQDIGNCKECDPKRVIAIDGMPLTLDDAQDAYNDAVNAVKELEIKVTQAERGDTTALRDTKEALEDAQRDLQWALQGPDALKVLLAQSEVSLAEAKLKDAQTTYAKVKNGPDPEKLAAAEARLKSAQAALTAAQAALEDNELRAPFAGTVARVKLKVGEQVSPGQAVVTLADFTTWEIDTDNLTEIEVVKIQEGQAAKVVLDALPDVTLNGTVTQIASVFEEKRGDVTYTVKVLLKDTNPSIRWGMTAAVTFEK
jgi:multidrug resistance efflux pump